MKPYIPVYNRPPCKALEYRTEPFDDGAGHTGTVRIVRYLDKNKKEQEMVIQVIWDKNNR